jgi:hypothetical protein
MITEILRKTPKPNRPLKVGDVVTEPEGNTPYMIVRTILSDRYCYVNLFNGEISAEYNSLEELKEVNSDDVIYEAKLILKEI